MPHEERCIMSITHLDYKPVKLSMECTNQVEENYRVVACAKEPWTMAFIDSIPAEATFWDLGANVGPYTLVAASRGLRVVAIEPGFNNYATLCRNLAMNNLLDRVITLCLAVGERTGFDWFHYQDTRSGAADHILGSVRKQFFHRQLVAVWALDDLAPRLPLAEGPYYLKIDVDAGELAVLKGAPAFLRKDDLRGIICE